MNDSTLNKLWTTCASLVLYLSVNVWSATQGGRIELPALLKFNAGKDGAVISYGASLYGILLIAPALLALLWLTRLHARKHKNAVFRHDRIPIFADMGIDPATQEGRWFQRAVVAGFIVLPLILQIHYMDKFTSGTASSTAAGMLPITGFGHFLASPRLFLAHQSYRYDTLSYFPFVGPWILAALQLAVAWAAWKTFRAVRGMD